MKYLIWIGLAVLLYWAWRSYATSGAGMSAFEAARLLEVSVDADVETINAAHRRLIAKVHPDAGGSAELAQRVNQARDILLRRLG
jgi:DnaJ homolog subfamily C member 19